MNINHYVPFLARVDDTVITQRKVLRDKYVCTHTLLESKRKNNQVKEIKQMCKKLMTDEKSF